MRTSIQRRLFAILGLFVLANALVWSGLALLLAYIVEDEIIDRVLVSQSRVIFETYEVSGELTRPALPELRLFDGRDQVPTDIRALVKPAPGGGEVFTQDRTHYHYRWLPLPGRGPVLLLAEVSPWLVVTHFSSALLTLMLVGTLVATCFGLLAAATIARITTRPLRELTNAIEAEPRPSPLPHGNQPDEVGVLAATMDAALTDLQRALARERDFTRDVSHELRTPLTSLRNALQLLPQGVLSGPEAEDIRRAGQDIQQTVEALLALARAESAMQAPLQLRPVLERLLIERADVLEGGHFELDLRVPDDARIIANEQLLRLLLGNLLDNALHYAQPRQLSIVFHAGELLFENPLSASDTLPHSQSLGHGLALAQRLAAAHGWQLHTSSTDGLFCASISLTR